MGRRPTIQEARARRAAVSDGSVVLDAALRFLEPRSRSVAEVRRRLTQAGYRAELVDEAISRLLGLGMLDDEAFARHWIESRDRAHPRGTLALRRELREKGVPDEVVREVLEARASASDADGSDDGSEQAPGAEEAAARRLLERRSAALARIADPRSRRQRAYALLARNGFDPEVCARVAGSLSDEVDTD